MVATPVVSVALIVCVLGLAVDRLYHHCDDRSLIFCNWLRSSRFALFVFVVFVAIAVIGRRFDFRLDIKIFVSIGDVTLVRLSQ